MVWEIGLPLRLAGSLTDNPTDAQLSSECKRGSIRAFELLYQRQSPKLKSLALRLLGNRSDAEDAVQDAFLKVYKAIGSFDETAQFSTWIYRILINCCYDQMRKRQRSSEVPIVSEPARETSIPLKLALERALSRLNERARLVFVLFEVEGLKHSEIAAILQAPEGTCRSWLFDAKRELKRMLTERPQ